MAGGASKKQVSMAVEWAIAGLGMIVLAVALGFISFRALTSKSTPADLAVTVETVTNGNGGYRVDFIVTNTGAETAASVMIEGELIKGGQSVEKSSATIDYAPAHSTRRGGIYFSNDPKLYELKLRASGFEKP